MLELTTILSLCKFTTATKVEKFFDYGLESSFTLKAIYKYFEKPQQEL